jgi:hypothetical protein
MEFLVLFIIGWLIARAGASGKASNAPAGTNDSTIVTESHPHSSMWHEHTFDGARSHWHPDGVQTLWFVYDDEYPNPTSPLIIEP